MSGPTTVTTAELDPLIYLYRLNPAGMYTESLHLTEPLPFSLWKGKANCVSTNLEFEASCANNPSLVMAYIMGSPLAFLAINKSVTNPSGNGNLASLVSEPKVAACQSCPVLSIPHSLSSQNVRYLVSLVSSVKLLEGSDV